MLFDFLAVRLNPEKSAGKTFSINIDFTDIDKRYTLFVENSVLNHSQKQIKKADVDLTMSMKIMNDVQLKETTFDQAIKDGSVKINGDKKVFDDFLSMLDNFDFWFNIVTP